MSCHQNVTSQLEGPKAQLGCGEVWCAPSFSLGHVDCRCRTVLVQTRLIASACKTAEQGQLCHGRNKSNAPCTDNIVVVDLSRATRVSLVIEHTAQSLILLVFPTASSYAPPAPCYAPTRSLLRPTRSLLRPIRQSNAECSSQMLLR